MGTRDAILDATIEAVTLYGLAKLSMSDVATRAGISRPTLYKYFGSKDELIEAVVQREALALVSAVMAAADEHRETRDALDAAFVTALRLTREHPLLDRIIGTEPEALLPYLTTDRVDSGGGGGGGGGDGLGGGAAVLLFVRTAADTLIRERLADRIDEVMSRRLADMIARLLVSYAVSAPDDPPEVVAAIVTTILLDGALAADGTTSVGGAPGSTSTRRSP